MSKHMTLSERIEIEFLLKKRLSFKEIGRELVVVRLN
jgi:IS30 family transposase